MKILVISSVDKNIPLYELEFVRPITDIIAEIEEEFEIIHISAVDEHITADKIIITGTAYQDNVFLEHKKQIKHILGLNVPILGICAGAELLLPEEIKLEDIKEIGPLIVESLHEDDLTKELDGKECYFLHQKGIRAIPLGTDELVGLLATKKGIAAYRYKDKPVWGVQFHPEVDKKNVIRKFINN